MQKVNEQIQTLELQVLALKQQVKEQETTATYALEVFLGSNSLEDYTKAQKQLFYIAMSADHPEINTPEIRSWLTDLHRRYLGFLEDLSSKPTQALQA